VFQHGDPDISNIETESSFPVGSAHSG